MPVYRNSNWAMVTLFAGALLTGACRQDPENAAIENGSENAALPLPPLPVAEPPIGREALLLAAARAGSAAALGRNDAAWQRELDGKRFEVRTRFGCPASGSETEGGSRFEVRFDERDRTLRLRAAPDLSLNDKAIAGLSSEAVEAVEGFWIQRPWLLADGCPRVPQLSQDSRQPEASGPASSGEGEARSPPAEPGRPASRAGEVPPPTPYPRIGIAEFFTDVDSRTGRRDHRAYEASKVLKEGEQPSAEGYNLVLSGRLRAQPLGRVISCAVVGIDAPPQCVVSAQIDRVWIEQPESKQIIAEWSS
ncbi:MAG TPA: hypothetical protein VFZ88_08160 [Sphingomicrobium sp.]